MELETGHLNKAELVPRLAATAVNFVTRFGSEGACEGLSGPIMTVTVKQLAIAYRSPKSMAHGESNFGVDVWYDYKKVFSVCWNSNVLKDYEVVNFKRGPWIIALLNIEVK